MTPLTLNRLERSQVEAGVSIVAEALALVEQTGMRWYEAEMYRIKGALLLPQADPDAAQAEACFQQALDIARRQEAKSWELRAGTSLARLWEPQDKRQSAYDLVAPVYAVQRGLYHGRPVRS